VQHEHCAVATWRGCPPLAKSACQHLFAMSFKGMAIAHWLETEYSRITRQAVAEGAEIYWGDETSQITSDLRGRGCAPRSRTPVRPIRSRRQSVRYLSVIGNTGLLRFMVRKKGIAAPTRITVCKRVCQDAARIAVFDLPSYSPERPPTRTAMALPRCTWRSAWPCSAPRLVAGDRYSAAPRRSRSASVIRACPTRYDASCLRG